MSTIDTLVVLIVILSVVGTIVLGLVIVAAVESGHAIAHRATQLRDRLPHPGGRAGLPTPRPSAMADAEQLRVSLHHEISRTEDALERAEHRGLPIGELRQVARDLSGHAARLDEHLAVAIGHGTIRRAADLPEELRDQRDKLTGTCCRIRSALLDSELKQSSADLETSIRSARVEVEALRAGYEALADSPDAGLADLEPPRGKRTGDPPGPTPP